MKLTVSEFPVIVEVVVVVEASAADVLAAATEVELILVEATLAETDSEVEANADVEVNTDVEIDSEAETNSDELIDSESEIDVDVDVDSLAETEALSNAEALVSVEGRTTVSWFASTVLAEVVVVTTSALTFSANKTEPPIKAPAAAIPFSAPIDTE